MKDRMRERNLRLSEEEALGLLEVTMMSPSDLTVEQRNAIVKLSEFCREFLRDEDRDAKEVLPIAAELTRSAPAYAA